MTRENYPSKLLNEAVNQFSRLPGIGDRTALRLALHMLRIRKEDAINFSNVLKAFVEEIKFCKQCYNLSDEDICPICSSTSRQRNVICVVENVKDVMSVENTHQFNGIYHVLGGLISPMEGIGPKDLQIESLLERIHEENIEEIILALSATMEGDTTNFYIFRKLKDSSIKISVIARGVSFGDELEYTDDLTLGRSILNRVPFENNTPPS